jgi:hypothetical protein
MTIVVQTSGLGACHYGARRGRSRAARLRTPRSMPTSRMSGAETDEEQQPDECSSERQKTIETAENDRNDWQSHNSSRLDQRDPIDMSDAPIYPQRKRGGATSGLPAACQGSFRNMAQSTDPPPG